MIEALLILNTVLLLSVIYAIANPKEVEGIKKSTSPQRRFKAQKREPRIIAKTEAREAEIEEERLAKMGWDTNAGPPL